MLWNKKIFDPNGCRTHGTNSTRLCFNDRDQLKPQLRKFTNLENSQKIKLHSTNFASIKYKELLKYIFCWIFQKKIKDKFFVSLLISELNIRNVTQTFDHQEQKIKKITKKSFVCFFSKYFLNFWNRVWISSSNRDYGKSQSLKCDSRKYQRAWTLINVL